MNEHTKEAARGIVIGILLLIVLNVSRALLIEAGMLFP